MNERLKDAIKTGRSLVQGSGVLDLRAKSFVGGGGIGHHLSTHLGSGSEAAEARLYREGDDPRYIDWSATARTGYVQVRNTYADRPLRTVVVLDASGSMFFGTSHLLKYEMAVGTIAALCSSSDARGDFVGCMLVAPGSNLWIPPGSGKEHSAIVLGATASQVKKDGDIDFLGALKRVSTLCHHKQGTVVVFTDLDKLLTEKFDEHIAAFRRLSYEHNLVIVACKDRREEEIFGVGVIDIQDPETGEVFTVDTDSAKVQKAFLEIAAKNRKARIEACKRSGASLVELYCEKGWHKKLAAADWGVRR